MRYWILAIVAVIIAVLRVQDIPNGEHLVSIPHLAAKGYTNNDMWYYCWSRVLEALPWTIAYFETRQKPILWVALVCWLRVLDERSVPFIDFSWPEFVGWVIALLVCLRTKELDKAIDRIWTKGSRVQ